MPANSVSRNPVSFSPEEPSLLRALSPADESSNTLPGEEDPTAAGDGDGDGDITEESLEDARGIVADDTWNAHAIGVRGGLTVVPPWILSSFLASHTNSLCRGETLGPFGWYWFFSGAGSFSAL